MRMVFLIAGLCLFLSGCSKLIFPYEEEKLCNKGIGQGFCGSVSEIYEDSVKNPWRYGIR